MRCGAVQAGISYCSARRLPAGTLPCCTSVPSFGRVAPVRVPACQLPLPARSIPPVQCCCRRCAPARLVASDPAASKQKAKRLRCPEERAVDENGKQAMELQLRRRSGEASNNAAASIIAGRSTSDCLWTRSGGATRLHRPAFLSFL